MMTKYKLVLILLTKLARHYRGQNDVYRAYAFEQAVEQLKSNDFKKPKDAISLPGIGKGIMMRIIEIWKTGNLQELHHPLSGIPGLGKRIREQIESVYPNIKSAYQLKKLVKKGEIILPKSAQIGLKYMTGPVFYSDNIEFDYITKLKTKMEAWTAKHFSSTKLHFVGSYRLKRAVCSDIKIVLVDSIQQPPNSGLLSHYVIALAKKDFLVDHLTHQLTLLRQKYMGFCKGNNPSRVYRINIYHIPKQDLQAAIFYLTGPDWFIKQMHKVAKRYGYKLNIYGLVSINTGQKVLIQSERDIFKRLHLAYIEPSKR